MGSGRRVRTDHAAAWQVLNREPEVQVKVDRGNGNRVRWVPRVAVQGLAPARCCIPRTDEREEQRLERAEVVRCGENRLVSYNSWRVMPRRQLDLLLIVASLVHVKSQTPCRDKMNSRPCYDDDDGGAEVGVVVGVVCSLLLALVVAVVAWRTRGCRPRSQASKNGTPPPAPTPTPPEMAPLTDMKPLVTRMVLSHDGVKTITRQGSASPVQQAIQRKTAGGPSEYRLEGITPPNQTQGASPVSGTTKTRQGLRDEGRSSSGSERSGSGKRRRTRRNSFEHDEPGLQRLQRALADQERASALKIGARSAVAAVPRYGSRTDRMSIASSSPTGDGCAFDSIAETRTGEIVTLLNSTVASLRINPSLTTLAGVGNRANVEEGIPRSRKAHGGV
eukprot:COSAG02_NODE_5265_length_4486_cov_2.841577_4_plen_391_part_00